MLTQGGLAFGTWYFLVHTLAGRRATRIITVSQFSKHELVAGLELPAERIAVVAEGADHIERVESGGPVQAPRTRPTAVTARRTARLCAQENTIAGR